MTRQADRWKFDPHPLISGCHQQTIFAIHWPRRCPPYRAVQHYVQLEDDDRLVLHEDAPAGADDAAPIVLLIHGLTGCHLSTYMVRNAERLTERGYRVFRMDMRGCGAGEALAKWPNHCGRWPDVAAVLCHIAELYPDADTSIVGYSMGGTLAMNLLAEAGDMRVGNLQRSLVICPPIDLFHVEYHFRGFPGRLYDRFFVKSLWRQVLDRWRRFPEVAPHKIPQRRPKRYHDITQLDTAPHGRFHSPEDYYRQASPGPKLAAVRQPLMIVFSQDDPVVPIAPLFATKLSSSIETVTPARGGHLGFLARRNGDPDFRWLDWRIIEWLAESGHAPPVARRDTSAIPAAARSSTRA